MKHGTLRIAICIPSEWFDNVFFLFIPVFLIIIHFCAKTKTWYLIHEVHYMQLQGAGRPNGMSVRIFWVLFTNMSDLFCIRGDASG